MDSDVIIIGAGLLGCFMARNLRKYNLTVQVIEKAPDVCTGISKANTGIIYPGYDMATGSLKARLTVKACREFPALCETLGVPFNPCGSLMVGFGPNGKKSIENKYEKGIANGVTGLELLDPGQCLALEPSLAPDVLIGLYSPDTCTVNPWDLCIAGYENAVANGASFIFDTEVTDIKRLQENGQQLFSVFIKKNMDLGKTPSDTIASDASSRGHLTCRCLINCAGMSSALVHEMLSTPSIRLNPTGADYFILEEDPAQMPGHVIFHEPEEKGKGLTIIPTVDHNTMVGPTERDNPDLIGTPTKADELSFLKEHCHKYLPAMPTEHIIHTFGSARPNPFEVIPENGTWVRSKKRLSDFNILEEDGFFNLIGVKTPGLTCCNVLGEYIADKVVSHLGNVTENPDYNPHRTAPIRVHALSLEERSTYIQKDPAYGRIICSCRDISEAEIQSAIRRGAHTLDGVKRRCGVLMGQCQGSRCLKKVLEIMADEMGCSVNEIPKEARSAYILR